MRWEVPRVVNAELLGRMGEGKLQRCSLAFVLSPVMVACGVCVLGLALGTLAVTSSFFVVFPFGAPLWNGSLFVIIGCFTLVVYRPTEQILSMSSKAQVWFTFIASVIAAVESLLAISLSVWYSTLVLPALTDCTTDYGMASTCECSEGFINPPSLLRTVYRFKGVGDCNKLLEFVAGFRYALLGLYCLGFILTVLLALASVKRLHSLGVCGPSGVYNVTFAPTPAPPTPPRQPSVIPPPSYPPPPPSFSSSHPRQPSTLVTRRVASQPALRTASPASVKPHASSSHAIL